MSRTPSRTPGNNEMENRDATPDEIAAIVGDVTVVPTAPYDPSRDDDADDDPPRAAPIAAIDVERLNAAIKSIESRQSDAHSPDLAAAIAMLATAISGMQSTQLQAANIQADMQRRATIPENKFPPMISAFNPRGDKDFPRPQLKCEMFIPWPVQNEACTREEIELLNLLQPGEFYITRTDRSKVKMVVRIEKKLDSEEPSRLFVNHETAFNNDNHRTMPHDWIRQLVRANPKTKAAAAMVLTMDEEVALIEAHQFNDGRTAGTNESVVSVGM